MNSSRLRRSWEHAGSCRGMGATAHPHGSAVPRLFGCRQRPRWRRRRQLGRLSAPGPPPSASADPSHWLTALDRDHPLVGKIWSVREARFTDQPSVLRALGDASFVLLGEKHDNPDHHRLQARVLAALVARGKKPVVAWEMLELPAQARLDAYRAQAGATAENLGPALSWESSSWPPWPEYLPIAEVAFEGQLRMVAANLPQSLARSLAHEGASALGPQGAQRLGLDHPFPGELETSLRDELRASHCGHLPETMIAPMALAQHARDAQMAKSMKDAASPKGSCSLPAPATCASIEGCPSIWRWAAKRRRRQHRPDRSRDRRDFPAVVRPPIRRGVAPLRLRVVHPA